MANSSRPRNSLAIHHHSTIDSCLKTLRTTVRNVSAFEEALAEEAQILERLYYKSKNQHRSALFWRHVCEIRRICGRIMTLDKKGKVGRCLDTLRSSFHEPQSDGAELSNKASVGLFFTFGDRFSFAAHVIQSETPGVVPLAVGQIAHLPHAPVV